MSLLDGAYALIATPFRAIGFIIPEVTVEEVHRDQLIITDHPVERGAAISDHAFKMPSEIEMRVGWSNSSAGFSGYVNIVYQALLKLQNIRQPFVVATGKRIYTNMLIRSLEVITDDHSENALFVSANLREVIIVDTQTTSMGAMGNQAAPQKTASVAGAGTKQVVLSSPTANSTGPIAAAGG